MKDKKNSVVFMGSADFAVPSLKAVYENYNLKAVVTVPDKPKGRGRKVLPSPVKKAALDIGVEILQPHNLNSEEFISGLKEISPDIIVVIAFRILPVAVFSISKIATFNVHGSLLPKYRGAAPVQRAVMNSEKETGLTSFILESKVDTGNIIMQVTEEISPDDTAGDLLDRLKLKAAPLTVKTIEILTRGNFSPEKQDESKATKAPKLFRKDLKIDFNDTAEKVRSFIHGTSPIPGAWTIMNGKNLKILRVGISDISLNAGEYSIENGEFLIGCADKSLILKEFQFSGKPVVSADVFINGYRDEKRGFLE